MRLVLAWVEQFLRDSPPLTAPTPRNGHIATGTAGCLSADGIGAARALEVFADVLLPATRTTGHPMDLAYVPAAPTRAALAFDAVVGATNVFAGMWEAGAGVIHAENQVLSWLAGLLGWPDGAGGCFVPGATHGTLSALVAARDAARRARIAAGLAARPTAGWAVVSSDQAHPALDVVGAVMDVDVVRLPTDSQGRLTAGTVNAGLAGLTAEPFAVVATAGTTLTGAVDDLSGVAESCHRRSVWLHVDGAYGGAALAAPRTRHLFAGIEHADSFVVDPHKWLFAPYDSCALLYRRPIQAVAAHARRGGVLNQDVRVDDNPADLAVHLTRRARGLPLWFSLAVHGTRAYGRAIATSLDTAATVADAISARPYLALVHRPQLSVVVFERVGWPVERYQQWSHDLAADGRMLCLPAQWRGRPVLRMAFTNPATDPTDVIAVLDTLST